MRRGVFTLIELLVVVAIIAVLVAILLPALGAARERARRTVCASNLHNMYLALACYNNDYNELPPGEWGESYFMGGNVDYYLYKNYGLGIKLTICPSSAEYRDPGWWIWGSIHWDWGKMTYHYLGGNGGCGWPTNGWYVGGNTSYFRWPSEGFYPRKSLTESKFASDGFFDRMPLMLDIATYYDEIRYWNKPWRSNHVGSKGTARAAGENILFYDGHQEWQDLISGKSWRFGRDYYDPFWITEPAGPPDGDENYIVP